MEDINETREFKNWTSLPFITKNNGYEISVYDQEMRGPIFNDHQKIKKIIFKKIEEDNKKGKRVSILLLNRIASIKECKNP